LSQAASFLISTPHQSWTIARLLDLRCGNVAFSIWLKSTVNRTERVMAIESFEIVSVPVADQEKSKVFYRDVLGFMLLREEPMGPTSKWIQLAPPGCSTTIALVTWFDGMKPGGLQGVMLNTNDIEGDHRLLSSRGLALSPIGQEPWGRYTMFKDPDGNGWILRQPPAPPQLGR
jgi:catechol 2,3-dioxygenase-like lactoylglutathione lyase family enzyme